GREVKKDTVDEVAAAVLAMGEDTRLNVLFPLQTAATEAAESDRKKKSRGKRAASETRPRAFEDVSDALKIRLFDLRKRGFNRLYQGGRIFEFSTPESLLDINFSEPVFLLADRIAVSLEARSRIVDAIETCYRESGEAIFETPPRGDDPRRQIRFANRFECKHCGIRCEEPEPRLFSFNNPYGACPRCQGFGNTIDFDLTLVVPDPSKTLNEGAIEPWTKPKGRPWFTELKRFAKPAGIPLDVPWAELSPEHRRLVIEGERRFPGIRGFFQYLERKKYKLHVRVFLSRYRGYSTCSECGGARLRREARQVKIAGKNICEVCSMTVEEAAAFFERLEACSPENKQAAPEALVRGRADEGFHPYTPMGGDDPLSREEAGIAEKLLQEIRSRLRFLNDVGLEYLMLDRLTSTLSGGEAQRIQLATSLGSRLVGTLYVLDEPSIGLHSRDTHRLINILHGLRDLGNTVLVVEHDPDVMRASDRILDLGPGAGEHGGKVIATGTYDQIKETATSLTGRYLAHELRIQTPTNRRKPGRQRITIRGARAHNLKQIDVMVPLGMLVAITGVSGSGKSTLLHDVLYHGLRARKNQTNDAPLTSASFEEIAGDEFIDDVVLVDQSPIGRT